MRLFGMLPDVFQPVGIVHNLEIETPVPRYPSLPHIVGFMVLLGTQGWMVKILGKEVELFAKGLADSDWGFSSASSTRSV
jgi:hypothetical protein